MVTLLIAVLILGVIAYAVRSFDIPAPFKAVAYCIMLIIIIILVANAFGYGPNISLR